MDFTAFKTVLQQQFNKMKKHKLYQFDTEKNLLWMLYLDSFPKGSDPIYKTNSTHNCSACRGFIKKAGNIGAVIDGKMVSLWDVSIEDATYQKVANAMSEFVKSHKIRDIFLHKEQVIGIDKNFRQETDGSVTMFQHFHLNIPSEFYAFGTDLISKRDTARVNRQVLERSLNEITVDSCNIVLDLIYSNSLYRGEEHKFQVNKFLQLKKEYDQLANESEKEIFCWEHSDLSQSIVRIKNTVIGTLLADISENMPLERAVNSFETKVAPINYKRPTAPISKAMLEQAKRDIEELGLLPSLDRRYAKIEDLSVNDILFADRSIKRLLHDNVFDEMIESMPAEIPSLDRVEEVSIDTFITEILPKAQKVEVLFQHKHKSNLMSLVAPNDFTAKPLFKWNNLFSWSYIGDVADSIKDRVKAAGGATEGYLRISLGWFNYDDLDLHLVAPDKTHLYYGDKKPHNIHGFLDVDMNVSPTTRKPVENIIFKEKDKTKDGVYTVFVEQFNKRERIDIGFELEMECEGKLMKFSHTHEMDSKQKVQVVQFKKSGDSIEILGSLSFAESNRSETIWGIDTNNFHAANLISLSPNHWDGEQGIGNKHYFFFLNKCVNDGTARGFYNEFLSPEMDKHRKVMEVVGSRMQTVESDRQLSGLGFSSTKRDQIVVRVSGSFNRILKVNF